MRAKTLRAGHLVGKFRQRSRQAFLANIDWIRLTAVYSNGLEFDLGGCVRHDARGGLAEQPASASEGLAEIARRGCDDAHLRHLRSQVPRRPKLETARVLERFTGHEEIDSQAGG